MSQSYKRVPAILDNAVTLYVYNMDTLAKLPKSIILSGKPETSVSQQGIVQYRFSHPPSGWFCSVAADDAERIANVLQVASGDIAIVVSSLVEVTAKDLATAKVFVPGKAK